MMSGAYPHDPYYTKRGFTHLPARQFTRTSTMGQTTTTQEVHPQWP